MAAGPDVTEGRTIDVLRRQLAAAQAERDEAQAQQTAMAEVLQVINASPGNLGPVFDAILEKARRLCDAAHGDLWTYDGEVLHLAATHGEPGFAAWLRAQGPVPVWPGSPTEMLMKGADHVQYEDPVRDGHFEAVPEFLAQVQRAGVRSTLFVPMLKDGKLLGVVIVYRREVRRFADKQVELLKGFAAQAVIAMENARLLTEQREALEQQTAATEVLEVINASPGDLAPVFGAMLEKAMHLCEAAFGIFGRFDGKLFEPAVDRGVPAELIATVRQIQSPPPNSGLGRLAAGESVVQLVDLANTDIYRAGFVGAKALVDIGGAKTAIFVALRKDNELRGVLVMYRREGRAFSDKQVALLQNFAAQAVIAMENARLLTEQREALEQQTATAEVLQVISQSPTDVEPVLQAVVAAARRFCGAEHADIFLREGDEIIAGPHDGPISSQALGNRDPLNRESSRGVTILDARTTHIPDIQALAPEQYPFAQAYGRQFKFRATVNAPMLRDGRAIGCVTLRKPEPGPFTPRQIQLLETFAAQAVIAIENVRLFTELKESLERQTATTEILQTINGSPGDPQPVFDAIVDKAMTLCGAAFGMFNLYDGEHFHTVATRGVPEVYARFRAENPPDYSPQSGPGRMIAGEDFVHEADMADHELYRSGDPNRRSIVDLGGARTILSVALRKEGTLLGMIAIYRQEVRPFSDKEMALLQGFAAQAVIAMENARLLTELRESLEQQTATADILRVISQSPTDVQPVLKTIVQAALRFCGAEDAVVLLREGEQWLIAGHEGPMVAEVGTRQPLSRQTAPGQAMLDGVTTHFPDIGTLDAVEFAAAHEFGRRHGFQAALAAPMLRDGAPIGAIALRRSQAGAFTPRQIELLESFAAQAVIALENTRLFTELKESLDYQTATSELLEVISRSATDIQPVFDTMLASAARLCGVEKGDIAVRQGDAYRHAAAINPTADELQWLKQRSLTPSRGTTAGRALLERKVVQVLDQSRDTELAHPDTVRQARTVIAVPLLREDEPVGVITLLRANVEPFGEREVALLRTFADQAVIAMQNARLLSELRESLEQQTATADILRVISQSPNDVTPVLEAVASAAMRFCNAVDASVCLRDGDHWTPAAHQGTFTSIVGERFALNRESIVGRTIVDARTLHIPDTQDLDPVEWPMARDLTGRLGVRSFLAVPLLRDGAAIGTISLRRPTPGPFTEKQIEIAEAFAAQAVIAIENVRLFTELRQRTDDLTQSLEYQTATSEVLEVIGRSTSDIQPVLDTMLSAALRLCATKSGGIAIQQGEGFHYAATLGWDPEADAMFRSLEIKPGRGTVAARVLADCRVVHVSDVASDPEFEWPDMAALAHWHTALGVPLMREGRPIGAIAITRDRVEPFTDRQIALVKTFADQAVIAMENARLLSELRTRTDDLTQSLEYQTATSELLEVISRSASDIQPVFDTMLASAARLCGVQMGGAAVRQGEVLRYVNSTGVSAEFDAWLRATPHPIDRTSVAGRAALTKRIAYIPDVAADPDYAMAHTTTLGNMRSLMAVPLLREDEVLGTITVGRSNTEPFTDRQISLLRTFADQAVIAMENARLLSELTQRTGDLTQSLEYQTATSELLEVISRSTSDIQPVLDTMLASAARLCGIQMGGVVVRQGDVLRYVATMGMPESYDRFLRETPHAIDRKTSAGRAVLTKQTVYIRDVQADPDYGMTETTTLGGFRSLFSVPLMREGEAVGAIALGRTDSAPLTERQIALVKTFADQAVIAMENARLLGELTRREQELRITFDHMGDAVVMFDADLALASWNRNFQEMLDIPDSFLAGRPGLDDYVRLLLERGELGNESEESQVARFRERIGQQWSSERMRPNGRILEVRNNPVPGGGSVLIYSDITERKQAEAEIEAARDAAEAALERQTATADILKVIASSPTDVQPVLDVVAKAAVRFCGATDANIHLREGDQALSAAHAGTLGASPGIRRPLDRQTGFGQAILDCRTIHVPDVEALDPVEFATTRRLAIEFGFRAVIAAPLLREGTAVGALSLRRTEPGAFTPQQIELLETFAAQAVIAIENVRLFTELRDSLDRLKAAQANLVQSEKMASLGQLTAGIAHEIKNPLNFVNNFATLSVDLLDELKEVAGPALATLDEDRRAELDETMELLTSNLGKIAEHGKRADGIVKSMLSHSRGSSGDWAPSDINALVEEALNLAYHGARAQDKEFNVTLERDFEKAGRPIEVVPQDVTRVFLNLFGNGFYAANKRRTAAKEAGFRPTIKVATRDLGDAVEVRVRDNGIGIPPEVRDKLFQPFFTTKPTGEGTGLGLSISYDIVTQQHGGTIQVESEPNNYTEFTVRLPRARRAADVSRGS